MLRNVASFDLDVCLIHDFDFPGRAFSPRHDSLAENNNKVNHLIFY